MTDSRLTVYLLIIYLFENNVLLNFLFFFLLLIDESVDAINISKYSSPISNY